MKEQFDGNIGRPSGRCPKCDGSDAFDSPKFRTGQKDFEYLVWGCQWCGYEAFTPTAKKWPFSEVRASVNCSGHHNLTAAVAISKVPRMLVRRWADAGIVRPHGGGASGKRFEFTFRNLVELKVCHAIHTLGLNEPAMRELVRDMAKWIDGDGDMNFFDWHRGGCRLSLLRVDLGRLIADVQLTSADYLKVAGS